LWGKLYKKSLFDNYIVPTNISFGEDTIVSIQLFSKTNLNKLQKLDKILYNYDMRANGLSSSFITHKKQYDSFFEDPLAAYNLWIEKYFENIGINKTIKSLFMINMIGSIVIYLRFNKKILRDEIEIFYKKYYKNCISINTLKIWDRVVIPLFYHSIFLGKWYVDIINQLAFLRKILIKLCGPGLKSHRT
jgi:hypothetical protein